MNLRRTMILFALVLVAATGPSVNGHPTTETISGWLTTDASCAQTPYVLAACSCVPPQIINYVFSTKIDLSQYTGNFVSLHGSFQPGNCQAPLFKAKKVAIEPLRPCPCP